MYDFKINVLATDNSKNHEYVLSVLAYRFIFIL